MWFKAANGTDTSIWIALTFVCGLAITAFAVWRQAKLNDVEVASALRNATERIAADVIDRISLYEYGVRGSRGAVIVAGPEQISQDLFVRYSRSRNIEIEFPGARGFGFIRRVPPEEEAAYVAAMRRDGRPEFRVYQLAPHSGERWVTQFIEPSNRNIAAVGLDIASEPNRREAAEISMRTGDPTITAPIILMQNPDPNQKAFLIILPVYRPDVPVGSAAEREAALVGWAYAALTMGEVMAQLRFDTNALHLRLHDVTDRGEEVLIYNTSIAEQTPELLQHTVRRSVFGREWAVEVGAYPPFVKALNLTQPHTVAIIGLVASILLAALAGAESVSRQRKRLIVARMADFNAQLERQVVERTDELVKAKAAAESANAARGRFLAIMSHELRTPMAGVLGIGDLLLNSDLRPDQKELLATLIGTARDLLHLLNDILDFAKIEAGRLELEQVDFSLRKMVADVCTVLAPLARENGNVIDVVIEGSIGPAQRGDPKRYRQILMNLVGNASKFTKNGKITISISAHSREDGRLTVKTTVADTGAGIAPANRERLFQPFVQEESSTSRKYGGTGLGLAISKTLAELMGGRIWAESEPGLESSFSYTVVLGVGDEALIKVNEEYSLTTAAPHAPTTKPQRILVAEDNEANRMLAVRILTNMGHRVTSAEDGAVAVAETQRHEFDIVLMDMQMPVMDGPAAMRTIRNSGGWRQNIPIIALTADAIQEHHRAYLDAGASLVLTKPVNWRRLAAEIEQLTRGSGAVQKGAAAAEPVRHEAVLDSELLDEMHGAIGVEMMRVAAKMEQELSGLVEKLASTARAGDMDAVRRIAHSVKGLAAQFGGGQVAAAARSAEVAAKEGAWSHARAQAIEVAAARFLAALNDWRSRRQSPSA